MKHEHPEEGPRGFAVVLQQVDEGSLHGELSETLQKVTRELAEYADKFTTVAKGAITLTLGFAVDPNGTVTVEGDIKTKLPKARRARSLFWLTKGHNLSAENPRQTKLPLREVPSNRDKAREVAEGSAPARSV